MRAFDGGAAVRVPGDRYLADDPPATGEVGGLARTVPLVKKFGVGVDCDQMLGQPGEFADGLLTRHGHPDADRNVRHVPQSCGVHLEVLAAPVDRPAAE